MLSLLFVQHNGNRKREVQHYSNYLATVANDDDPRRKMENIPRFNPTITQSDWPWINCDAGAPEHCQKYALLHKLNIPLGTSVVDITCRSQILMQLMDFSEKVLRQDRQTIVNNNGRPHSVMKVSPFVKEERRNARTVEVFLKCLNESKNEAADVLSLYLSKKYTAEYCKHAEAAQRSTKPKRVFPSDLIMHDGSDRADFLHCTWNTRYTELLEYKKIHGDCLVPIRRSPEDDKYRVLGRWVSHSRTSHKNGSMPEKRAQLLDAIGFCWRAATFVNVKDNPLLHKSVAAKLVYPSVTAREAMLLSGFGIEVASDDTRKKLVNNIVCQFYKRSFYCKDAVLKLMARLPGDVLEIYEESEVRTKLLEEGKLTDGVVELVVVHDEQEGNKQNDDDNVDDSIEAPMQKRQRTDENDIHVVDDGMAQRKQPPLRFA